MGASPAKPDDKPDQVVQLSKFVVDEAGLAGLAPDVLALNKVAGGVDLVNALDYQQGRVATAADALSLQPGVFAQSSGGQDAIKISIRGSGVNRGTGFFRDGVYFEFDGLPLTGPSGTPFELLEPLGVSAIEILKGGNGFESGALALGGAINYITNTGYDAPGNLARFEAGSFGYFKGELSTGGVVGNVDYYASIISSVRQGYQTHSDAKAAGFIADFGYKFNGNVDSRVYIRFRYTQFDNPGALTKAQLKTDPEQGSPLPTGNVAFNSYRVQPGSVWVGDNTTIKIDPDSKLELGAAFHDYPISIVTTGSPFTGSSLAPVFNSNITPAYNAALATTSAYNGGTFARWWYDDVSFQAKYTHSGEVFGDKDDLTLEVRNTNNPTGGVTTSVNFAGSPYYQDKFRERNFNGSDDGVALVNNDLELAPKLWLSTGLAGTYTKRVEDYTLPVVNNYTQTKHNYLYEAGLRYDLTANVELFGNVSRAVEPANAWAYVAPTNASSLNIQPQTSTNFEVGARASYGIFATAVSLYQENVRDELQSVLLNPSNPSLGTVESNASPTTHKGVEAELDTLLWQESGRGSSLNPEAPATSDRVVFRQSYTLSDFHFKDDPKFGTNELAGLPRNYYQAELTYQKANGFYAGLTGQVASSYYIDYANTFTVDGYAIWGARIGYAPPKQKWQVFLTATNLGNVAYASSISPTYNAAHADVAVSNVGDGRGFAGGFEFHY